MVFLGLVLLTAAGHTWLATGTVDQATEPDTRGVARLQPFPTDEQNRQRTLIRANSPTHRAISSTATASTVVVGAGGNATALELLLSDTRNDFAVRFERQQIYNPTLVMDSASGSLLMYTRFEGRNSIGRWKFCPTDSLYQTQACPVPDLRMVSFVATCRLNPATFQCR